MSTTTLYESNLTQSVQLKRPSFVTPKHSITSVSITPSTSSLQLGKSSMSERPQPPINIHQRVLTLPPTAIRKADSTMQSSNGALKFGEVIDAGSRVAESSRVVFSQKVKSDAYQKVSKNSSSELMHEDAPTACSTTYLKSEIRRLPSIQILQKPLLRNPDTIPKLQNIVCTFTLTTKQNQPVELDLRQVALHSRNSEYNPKRFAACIMRVREPKTTALVFRSGKVVCTGAKTEEIAEDACKMYAKQIKKLGYNCKMSDFKVQNCVASCDTKFSIQLLALASGAHSKFCQYDPELFPGLIYRMQKPKLVMLIFGSGKIVFTGAKDRESLHIAYDLIEPVLRSFRRQ